MIGTSSGPLEIPPLFGKPVLWTNATRFGVNLHRLNSLVIPKLITSQSQRNFDYFLNLGAYDADHIPNRFAGATFRNNSCDEIKMGVLEMLQGSIQLNNDTQFQIQNKLRLRGVWPTTLVSPYFANKHEEYFFQYKL